MEGSDPLLIEINVPWKKDVWCLFDVNNTQVTDGKFPHTTFCGWLTDSLLLVLYHSCTPPNSIKVHLSELKMICQ